MGQKKGGLHRWWIVGCSSCCWRRLRRRSSCTALRWARDKASVVLHRVGPLGRFSPTWSRRRPCQLIVSLSPSTEGGVSRLWPLLEVRLCPRGSPCLHLRINSLRRSLLYRLLCRPLPWHLRSQRSSSRL